MSSNCSGASSAVRSSAGGDFRSGKTPYDQLTVKLKITQGTATVEEVRWKAPTVRLALGGSASIPARDLDLKGTASLLSAPQRRRRRPSSCLRGAGPWDDPLDAAGRAER